MKFILGKKQEMTQVFKEDGEIVPVTVVKAGPCFITQIRTLDKDKYRSVQVGYQEAKKLNKPQKGHLKDLFQAKTLREFRLDDKDETEYKKGQQITVAVFNPGDKVKVTGVSKGRGFQGVVKRHGFSGSKATHGNKDQLRSSGSVGATGPAHVFKGMRMAGRMGTDQVSVVNLEIVEIDATKDLIYIKGALPGAKNGLIFITAPGEMDLTEKVEEVKKEEKKAKEKVEVTADETVETKKEDTEVKADVTTKKEDAESEPKAEKKKDNDNKETK